MSEPLTITSISSARDIEADDWDSLANPAGAPFDPFVSHAFFTALEESGSATSATGWQPLHLTARDCNGQLTGLMPLYLKSHSQGEYVFDQGWAQGFEIAGGRYYPKLLCAVPFTPVSGRRIFSADHAPFITSGFVDAALTFLKERGLSSFHLNFIQPDLAEQLEGKGFLLRRDTQFHWVDDGYDDFEGFLSSLQSRKRKALRKERRTALEAGIEIEWVSGSDIRPVHWDSFYKFYLDTGDRKWGRPYLNRAFFEMVGDSLAEHIVLIFALMDGKRIAGALNFKGSDTLYGRYWGALTYVPFLHFEICYYQAIDYALSAGLTRVEAGAQGQHKLLRGYAPRPTYSAHYIDHSGLKAAVRDFLEEEGRHVHYLDEVLTHHLPFKKDS